MRETFEVTIKEPLIGGYRYATITVEAESLKEAIAMVQDYEADDFDWELYPAKLQQAERDEKRNVEFSAKRIRPDNLNPPQFN